MLEPSTTLDRRDGAIVVSLEGEHDLHTAPQLKEVLSDAVAEGVPMVVDLDQAAFIDSSIIGAILDARRRASESGAGFAVALGGAGTPVARVLEVTGLDRTLNVARTLVDAIAAARRDAQEGAGGE